MTRKQRQRRKTSESSETGGAGELMPASAGIPPYLAMAASTLVGHPWTERTFIKERTDQVPLVVFHTIRPCTGLNTGFREVSNDAGSNLAHSGILTDSITGLGGVIANQSYSGVSRATAEADSYEATNPMGLFFDDVVWPTVQRLLQRNLRMTNFEVSKIGLWVIMVNTLKMQCAIHDYENIMNLYHALEESYPTSPQADAAFRHLKLMQPWKTEYKVKYEEMKAFVESLPKIGYFCHEVQRMMSPFMAPDAPQVHVPMSFDWLDQSGTTPANLLDRIFSGLETYRDHMIINYDTYLVTLNHVFPQIGSFPSVSSIPMPDVAKWQGRFNSSFVMNVTSGPAGDVSEDGSFVILMDETAADVGFVTNYEDLKNVFSVGEGESDANALDHARAYRSLGDMSLLSLISGDIFAYDDGIIDAWQALLSPHQWGNAWVPHHTSATDLTSTYLLVDGAHIAENQKHWAMAVGSRLIQEDTDEFFIPRGFKLILHLDQVMIGLRAMSRMLFGVDVMERTLSDKVGIDLKK